MVGICFVCAYCTTVCPRKSPPEKTSILLYMLTIISRRNTNLKSLPFIPPLFQPAAFSKGHMDTLLPQESHNLTLPPPPPPPQKSIHQRYNNRVPTSFPKQKVPTHQHRHPSFHCKASKQSKQASGNEEASLLPACTLLDAGVRVIHIHTTTTLPLPRL